MATSKHEQLAARVAAAYPAAAALVAGSTASGTTDEWSDIDLILFYEAWPGVAALESSRASLDPASLHVLGGDPEGDVFLEQFHVEGVACQLVHQTIAAWRATAATVLAEHQTSTPTQKALSGLHAGLVLSGDELIGGLRAEAAYPDELRLAMVRAHLDVFPLWRMQDSLSRRDAELWQRETLVAGFQKVLAILAGVSRVWFSTFQLKHQRELVAGFVESPPDLAARIDAALVAPMPVAADELESVLDETLEIAGRLLPAVADEVARYRNRHITRSSIENRAG
jgi:hypothetical protein